MPFLNQSGILVWTKGNIEMSPEACGVYILRDNQRAIIYIGKAGTRRLKARLLEHYNQRDIHAVCYFDWFQTISENDAESIERQWIEEYKPKYNG